MEFNRRTLLKLGAVTAGEVLLAACGVNAEPTQTSKGKLATSITYPNKAPVPTPGARPEIHGIPRDGLVPPTPNPNALIDMYKQPTPNIAQVKPKPEVGVRLTHEIKKGDLVLLSSGNWVEFEGGIIINRHPKLLIAINGTNLYNLYNNESLHLKSNNKDRLALGLFATEDGLQTSQELKIFKSELPNILAQSTFPHDTDFLPLGVAIDQVINDQKTKIAPGSPVTNIFFEADKVITVDWGISMISLANETLPQETKMRWSPELQYTFESQPVFHILSIN